MGNRGQPVRVVVRVGDLRLAHDGHRRPSAGIVVGVVHRSLRGDFLREAIQPIIGPGDRGRDGPTRILLLYLRDSVPSIIRVIDTRPVLERGLRSSV